MGLYFSQKPLAKIGIAFRIFEKNGTFSRLRRISESTIGGEKQRICLARVLLTYLLDEPSSSLDKETRGFIIEGFATISYRTKNR